MTTSDLRSEIVSLLQRALCIEDCERRDYGGVKP